MQPPFPSGLTPGAARRQAVLLLFFLYSVVYGGGYLIGGVPNRITALVASAFVLGALMLLVTVLCVRRDASWRESLGLENRPVGSMLGWSLLGFVGTYAGNLVLIGAYLAAQGNLEALAARKMSSLGMFAELPARVILALAVFAAMWEEIVFRGFLLGRLRAAMPKRDSRGAALCRDALAVLLTALVFATGHGYQGVLGLVQTAVAGVALGALTIWRKSLWPAIGAHLLIDAFGLVMLKALKPMLDTVASLTAGI
jgi:membrane protease YdiL (CAAX protease family)